MGILDSMKGFIASATKAYGSWGGATSPRGTMYMGNLGSSYNTTLQRLFFDIMEGCQDFDPRPRLDAYRLVSKHITPVAVAFSRKRDLVGNPIIESEDRGFADEVNAFLAEVKSKGELDAPYVTDMGIATVITKMLESDIYPLGQSFVSFLDASGQEIAHQNSMLEVVKIHDPARLCYQPTGEIDKYWLVYDAGGAQRYITTETRGFRALQFKRTEYPWGKPLIYETEFFLRNFLTAMGSREQFNARIGNPLSLTAFSYKISNDLDPSTAKKHTEIAQASAIQMESEYRAALSNKQRKLNAGVDIVASLPAENVNISQHVYGKDAKETTQYVPEIETLLKWACMGIGYPSVLLGFDAAGGGIGSEEFRYSAAAATNSACTEQTYLGMNLIKPMIDIFLLSQSKHPKPYRIVWDGQTLEDQKVLAETTKLQADGIKVQLEALELALMHLPENDSTELGQRLGLMKRD